ncbi:MAG: undecaprenyl-diphosphate phosphatase [Candidatus Pacebacteria bacterium]|nr:undecaprenyl-diphosphate phosphatase [Candidatus Paceibacterota bacterium]
MIYNHLMLTFFQAIVLGLSQGIAELFPISSLGHTILIPGLLGWHINTNAEGVIEFLVATHFATALVLFLIYRKDWFLIARGMSVSLRDRDIAPSNIYGKLGWLLVAATIPAGIVGLLFKDQLANLFISPRSAAAFLIANGFLLFGAELLRKRRIAAAAANEIETESGGDARLAYMTWRQSVGVGCMQMLALIPGLSRTGSTIAGGLLQKLSHEDALRFSFLLATPIIGAAALLELPPLLASGAAEIGIAFTGAVAAAIGAYFSAKFLARYFETKTLLPFAIYCAAMGILGLVLLR